MLIESDENDGMLVGGVSVMPGRDPVKDVVGVPTEIVGLRFKSVTESDGCGRAVSILFDGRETEGTLTESPVSID